MNNDNKNSQDLLNDAIREASGESARPQPTAVRPAAQRVPTITEALEEPPAATKVGAGETAPSAPSSARKLAVVVAWVAIVAVAAYYGWSQQRPTGPAAVLSDLAAGVEQYRLKHEGKLPASLAQTAALPAGAVEWPLRYWNARDAAGRTEIIWAPHGKHYRIVLRQAQAVWTISDRDATPKPFNQAKP